MASSDGAAFELMDIMRYPTPAGGVAEAGPKVAEALAQHTPPSLLDIYLFDGESSVCALLHPKMYSRVFKGWMRVGSQVWVLETAEDMIVELEVGEPWRSPEELTAIKKELYETLPNPLYHPGGHYLPLLAEEGYLRWDKNWASTLPEYTEGPNEQPITVRDMAVVESDTVDDLFGRKQRLAGQVGYTKTRDNTIKGRVLLKSKLCSFARRKRVPLMFSFVLATAQGIVKVYVWEQSVRQFFSLKEADAVLIRGFKIKRRQGTLLLANRTVSDADTQYASIPELSVNSSGPPGEIMKLPSDELDEVAAIKLDREFTTVSGVVEYVSSLLRWKVAGYGEKRLREFVYLRVSGVAIKLFSAGTTEDLLSIRAGRFIEVRHLRSAAIGEFRFYLSSLYTQFFFEEIGGLNTDATVISTLPRGVGLENAIGYLPVPFTTLSEYLEAAEAGLGTLSLNGVPISPTSPNAAYLHQDRPYFGQLLSIEAVKLAAAGLYMDEVERYLVAGRILGVNHRNHGDNIGQELLDISYTVTETTLGDISMSSFNETLPGTAELERVEEYVVVRIGEPDSYLDVQIFQNHLLSLRPFSASVADFLNMDIDSRSIHQAFKSKSAELAYFVVEAVRISEQVLVYLGISWLAHKK